MPKEILLGLEKINTDKLFEIRLRKGYPITVFYSGKRAYLGCSGITYNEKTSIKCDDNAIDGIVKKITEYSFYAFNENVKKGFLTTKDGIRVGVAGECVYGDKLITIKNFSSLNIRIPHNIDGSSDGFFGKIHVNDFFFNTLIVSPPFCGKTTVLKDVAKKINDNYSINVLMIDERGEFSCVGGKNIDSIKFSDKPYAFEYGIRSMSPDVIITDELSGKDDWLFVERAINSGVKVISTCHAASLNDVLQKDYYIKGVFDRYVVLKKGKFGEVAGVYDGDQNLL